MKFLFIFLFVITGLSAFGAGKIQNEDVKSAAELISAGSDASHLINDDKVWVKANSINQTLNAAILAGSLGGGGGGGGAQWYPDSSSAGPVQGFENTLTNWLFQPAATITAKLILYFQVPNSGYVAGKQIKLRAKAYSPSTSGQWKLQVVTTLIRTGTDAITSTTNQQTANGGDITQSTADLLTNVAINLTDASGQVNAVAVSPNDVLKLELTRINPTSTEDTADVRFIPGTTEVLLK